MSRLGAKDSTEFYKVQIARSWACELFRLCMQLHYDQQINYDVGWLNLFTITDSDAGLVY